MRRALLNISIFGVALVVSYAWVAWLILGGPAYPHEAPSGWRYPMACCSNKDCGMLPKGAVRETANGFVVTILPGQHDMVNDAPATFAIPYGEEDLSPDGADHICLSPAHKVLCFFTGGRGF